MHINLRFAVKATALSCVYKHIMHAYAFNVLEHHPDTIKRPEVNGKIAVPGEGGINSELREKLCCDIGRIGLHLSIYLQLENFRFFDDAFKKF